MFLENEANGADYILLRAFIIDYFIGVKPLQIMILDYSCLPRPKRFMNPTQIMHMTQMLTSKIVATLSHEK